MKYVYFLLIATIAGCASPRDGEPVGAAEGAAGAAERCESCKSGKHHEDDPAERVSVTPAPGALTIGGARAAHEIVVFTDLDCPYCQKLHGTLGEVAGSDVRVVVRHNPLPFHGEEARDAARAAIAATRLGKGDAFLRAWFGSDGPARLETAAIKAGISPEELSRVMRTPEVERALEADVAEAKRLGVRGTPTFFVDGRRTTGARSREAIAAKLAGG
jgi:protein-disulfide isomerase